MDSFCTFSLHILFGMNYFALDKRYEFISTFLGMNHFTLFIVMFLFWNFFEDMGYFVLF